MRKQLLASVAGSVALAVASGAHAQTAVTQTTNNAGPVTNTGTIAIGGGGITGVGGSAAVSATGAVSATSVTGINADLPGPTGGFGPVVMQGASNTGAVSNVNPDAVDISGGGGNFGDGASASITATGALTAFSFSGIGASQWTGIAVTGPVVQISLNNGTVTNDGAPAIAGFAGLGGAGSSASIGATGAAASVGLSFIGDGAVTGSRLRDIGQLVLNLGGGTTTNLNGSIALDGPISGTGASASISATGAIGSVSLSHIANTEGEGSFTLGSIGQIVGNAATVRNSGTITTTGGLSGPGTSAVVSATGAAASVSSGSIAATDDRGTPVIGTVSQIVLNSGDVTNTGNIALTGGIAGAGASASVSAVGAGAYASFSAISQTPIATVAAPAGGDAATPIYQAANNSGDISGSVTDRIITGGPVSGLGASVSVSTTGSAAAVGITGINADFGAPAIDDVTQHSTNSGSVTTPGADPEPPFSNPSNITVANVSGHGASVSVSSTGALSALSVAGLGDVEFSGVSVGNVTQITNNSGAVTTGEIVNNPNNDTPRGRIGGSSGNSARISGDGVSFAVTATGAASSVGSTFVRAAEGHAEIADGGTITQSTTGSGPVYNYGRSGTSSSHSGAGSSFSIAATGAISSVAGTVITSTGVTNVFGEVTQTTLATSSTYNQGLYNLSTGGHLNGNGMSASITATGAASVVSATAIGSTDTSTSFGNISQSTTTAAASTPVSWPASASVHNRSYFETHNGSLVGHGTSDSSSAIGAISSVSATVIDSDNTNLSFASAIQNTNNAASVRNDSMGSFDFRGYLGGDGSSLSISASGAASVFGITVIRSTGLDLDVIGNVNSTAVNSGTVINNNSASGTGANPEVMVVNPTLATGTLNATGNATTTALQGDGSSVSVTASGATAAFSVNSIGNDATPITVDVGTVSQTATNTGSVTNYGGTIAVNNVTTGQIAGAGSSATISASGAVASFSVSSINDAGTVSPTVGTITQTASNAGAVTNSPGASGTVAINVANGITGAGASASISAVGAGAYTSFSAIKSP